MIISASPDKRTLRKLALIRGIETVETRSRSYEEGLGELEERLMRNGIGLKAQTVVLTYGMREELIHLVKIIHLKTGE